MNCNGANTNNCCSDEHRCDKTFSDFGWGFSHKTGRLIHGALLSRTNIWRHALVFHSNLISKKIICIRKFPTSCGTSRIHSEPFGASEATIASKRGSPRSGSQKG